MASARGQRCARTHSRPGKLLPAARRLEYQQQNQRLTSPRCICEGHAGRASKWRNLAHHARLPPTPPAVRRDLQISPWLHHRRAHAHDRARSTDDTPTVTNQIEAIHLAHGRDWQQPVQIRWNRSRRWFPGSSEHTLRPRGRQDLCRAELDQQFAALLRREGLAAADFISSGGVMAPRWANIATSSSSRLPMPMMSILKAAERITAAGRSLGRGRGSPATRTLVSALTAVQHLPSSTRSAATRLSVVPAPRHQARNSSAGSFGQEAKDPPVVDGSREPIAPSGRHGPRSSARRVAQAFKRKGSSSRPGCAGAPRGGASSPGLLGISVLIDMARGSWLDLPPRPPRETRRRAWAPAVRFASRQAVRRVTFKRVRRFTRIFQRSQGSSISICRYVFAAT